MIKKIYFLSISLFFCSAIMAQKPNATKSFEISLKKDEKITTVYKNNQRINPETGMPLAIYGLAVSVEGSSPEDMAWNYLVENGKTLGLQERELSQLKHHATRSTNAGSVIRYRQYYKDVPVNKSEVTISISPENKVVNVASSFSYKMEKKVSTVAPALSLISAKSAASAYLPVENKLNHKGERLMIYQNKHMTRLAYEVTILSGGEWHVFVDAQTGEIFKVEDQAFYYCKHGDKKHNHTSCNTSDKGMTTAMVDGTGMVFNPDPLSSNQVPYGGAYVDNNDANSPELEASLFSVVLNDIEFTNGLYTLRGPYAHIADFDEPFTGLFRQDSSVFNFNREEQGFEPVNTYYHIDYLMRYVNETLECDVLPYQYAGGVRYDPHGVNGADNAYYSPAVGQLSFGEGCVDDAEDSDVIHHELGHGLHDWVTAGALSQVDGLSEGCGDYVAQSYNRGLGNWESTDPAYNWVFNWDGHNSCWNGRITNYNTAYPSGLIGQIHTDGQIWASCLMEIWDEIGQQRLDKVFYEGLGMTNGGSSQNDAANAVYQAALNLNYTAAELMAIYDGFTACGYTLPFLPTAPDDARLAAIVSPKGQYCDSLVQPIITLSNYGTNDLTSVDIIYDIDGMNPVTIPWSGMLASGTSIDYPLGTITVDGGDHTFNVRTENPNGNMDTNASNDNATSDFMVVIGGEGLSMELSTDNYGSETTWQLTDANNTVVFSGGDYDNNAVILETWCLEVGCYTWTIFDSYGDGICCGFGEGSFELVDEYGNPLGSGGDFDQETSVEFCLPLVLTAGFSVSELGCTNTPIAVTNSSQLATSYNWLAPGAMPDMSIDENPTFTYATPGTYTITLTADDGTGSSVAAQEVEILEGNGLVVNLLTDNYALETSYTITDQSTGNIVFFAENFDENAELFIEALCLDDGCYTWTIFDSEGDGICCDYGQGNYEILANDGSVIGNGGQFESSESVDFCLPYTGGGSNVAANFSISPSVCVGESVTVINNSANAESYTWSAPGAMPEVSTDENPTFSFTQSGTYTITLTASDTINSSTTEREIVVYEIPVVASIMGEAVPVNGSTETYSVPLNSGSTYTWRVEGGVQVSGGNTNAIEVMWNDANNMAFLCAIETDANGCQSEELCYDVLTVVSVEDIAFQNGLSIFPNPTDGMLYIESNQAPDNIEVFDVIGQRIEVDYQNNIINMSQQATGIYLLRITYEEGTVTRRIMLN